MATNTFKRSANNAYRLYGLIKNRRIVAQMFTDAWKGSYRISLFTMLAIIFSLLYLVFPLDLIPDVIPVLGWIDDGMLLYLLSKRIVWEAGKYLRWREVRMGEREEERS